MSEPRAWTDAEMRDMFIEHMKAMATYWANEKPSADSLAFYGGNKAMWRCHGLLHSFLAALDGCSDGLPAFDLTPAPHPNDKDFHQEEGTNWWDEVTINGGVMLHDLLRG